MASPLFHPAALSASTVEILVDGRRVAARPGQILAAVLLVAGAERFAPLCLMGSCFQCVVTVDGRANRRACRVEIAAGMQVVT